jgi:hypothetical protein
MKTSDRIPAKLFNKMIAKDKKSAAVVNINELDDGHVTSRTGKKKCNPNNSYLKECRQICNELKDEFAAGNLDPADLAKLAGNKKALAAKWFLDEMKSDDDIEKLTRLLMENEKTMIDLLKQAEKLRNLPVLKMFERLKALVAFL